jgi:hypothetical protein
MIEKTERNETRHEILAFADGSEIELDQQMRNDCVSAYGNACARAVSKRFIDGLSARAKDPAVSKPNVRSEPRAE